MKLAFIFLLVLLVGLAFGQSVYVGDYTTFQLFKNTSYEDSVAAHPDSNFYVLTLTDSHSEIESNAIEKYRVGGEVDVFARHIGPADSSLDVYIDIWRSEGFPDRTGWERHHLFLFNTADDTAYATLKDSTWFGNRMTNMYKIVIIKSNEGLMYDMITTRHFFRSK